MRLISTVTDYIKGSLLTTKGDIVKRGATANTRLPLGAANQVLAVNVAGNDLEYKYPGNPTFNTRYQGNNAGLVTILTGSTLIATVDLGTPALYDLFLIHCNVIAGKGATAGNIGLSLQKNSGTGSISFAYGHSNMRHIHWAAINVDNSITITVLGSITIAGTLVLKIEGFSIGSDATVQIGSGQIDVLRLTRN